MSANQPTYDALAPLYDIAFSWDVREEVDWLITRLGEGARRLLEPACGSGRMFPAFAERGVGIVGIERSTAMIQRARQRMAAQGLPEPRICQGDMQSSSLGEVFDGAVCPINSLGYLLDPDALRDHLAAVARHLKPKAAYLVQLDLMDTRVTVEYARDDCNQWDVEWRDKCLRTTWSALRFDATTGLQVEECRFEVCASAARSAGGTETAAPFAWKLPDDSWCADDFTRLNVGDVFADRHVLRKWNWEQWSAFIERSPFRLVAAYDGEADRRSLPMDEGVQDANLTWHELVSDNA